MSQKSSVPQAISFVSQVLKRDRPRTLTDPSPSVTAVVKWWLAMIRGLSRAL
jgi:hypothetical protein